MAGVRQLATDNASGHTAYYGRTSLRSIGAVVNGPVGLNSAGFWGTP